jgi:hypothetical protein
VDPDTVVAWIPLLSAAVAVLVMTGIVGAVQIYRELMVD